MLGNWGACALRNQLGIWVNWAIEGTGTWAGNSTNWELNWELESTNSTGHPTQPWESTGSNQLGLGHLGNRTGVWGNLGSNYARQRRAAVVWCELGELQVKLGNARGT